ncbi:MAG: amino acid ABC transporter permease [Lachnospiraceae bacterium]|nr:amino acid ABC transporter permease [Lachnospiraceae bacterium]
MNWFDKFCNDFTLNFIEGDRWKWILEGLGNTIIITIFALIIGVLLGIIIAAVRSTYDKNGADMKKRGGPAYVFLKIGNTLCNLYLTVVRGTPSVVQLLIMYFIILVNVTNGVFVAIIAFGLNSAAYVAEIFRGGIMSIDEGQFEAGRSLGFNYLQTMFHIILPQAIKVILPSLFNEFITLIKETAVAGYVGVMDLTKAGDKIRGRTFSAFMPLIAVALIYLGIVVLLTQLLKQLEKRLRKSER